MNLLKAIESGDGEAFLDCLDRGFKAAALAASLESHRLGLTVADGHAAKPGAPATPPDEVPPG